MPFDMAALNSLFSSPVFMGGLQLLAGNPRKSIADNLMTGVAAAGDYGYQQQSMLNQQQALKMNELRAQQMQRAADFNPQDYMQTTPAQGTAVQNSQMMPQLSATLGGINGGNTFEPTQGAVQPQPGIPTGRVDNPGLLAGALGAGMGPGDAAHISAMLDPQTAAAQALAGKFEKLAPGEMAMNGMGQPIAQNNNMPVSSPAAHIDQLTKVRDQFAPGSQQYQLYDAAIQKASGMFDQGMQIQRQQDLNQQRDFMRGVAQDRMAGTQAQRDQSNEFARQKQATVLSTLVAKSGIPEADQILSQIEGIMQKYPAGKLPGYGRVEGLLPTAMLPEDAQSLRQAVAQLANVKLKQRSGAAVTDQEMMRFKQELGTSTAVPEERIRQGITSMRKLIESEKRNYAAGASPDAISAYEEGGGMPLSQYRAAGGVRSQSQAAPKVDPGAAMQELRRRGLVK